MDSMFKNILESDISVIVLEEVDMSAKNLITDIVDHKKCKNYSNWKNYFKRIKETTQDMSSQLAGSLAMFLIVDRSLQIINEHIEWKTINLALKDYLGNKSAIGLSIELKEQRLCFIGCHLPAHEERLEERNKAIKTIKKEIRFQSNRKKIADHDSVIWAGDFNYRLVGPESYILGLIEENDYKKLAKLDQLKENWTSIIPEYCESALKFEPTFKYRPNTDS
ncbi:MAG: Inositol-1,4,5-trisphosphate 5-phosphatase 1 [Paramarteilia canceri]